MAKQSLFPKNRNRTIKAKELKEWLKDIPDDYTVLITASSNNNSPIVNSKCKAVYKWGRYIEFTNY